MLDALPPGLPGRPLAADGLAGVWFFGSFPFGLSFVIFIPSLPGGSSVRDNSYPGEYS